MKILIVSDTHRNSDNFFKALDIEGHIDRVIHAGDVEGEEYFYYKEAGCPVEIVGGNNDYFSDLPREKEFSIGKYNVFLTHGHYYHVALGYEYLVEEGISRDVDIVIFGHTHRPVVEYVDGLTIINPGSLTYPRQQGRRPSYVIMDINASGEASYEIKYL